MCELTQPDKDQASQNYILYLVF